MHLRSKNEQNDTTAKSVLTISKMWESWLDNMCVVYMKQQIIKNV